VLAEQVLKMTRYERYQPPGKDGLCPHGVKVSDVACHQCYQNKKVYKAASKRIRERADKLGW